MRLGTSSVFHLGDRSVARDEDGGVQLDGVLRLVGDDLGRSIDAEPHDAVGLGPDRKSTLVATSSSASHTCALLDDGSVRCFGWNDAGQGRQHLRPAPPRRHRSTRRRAVRDGRVAAAGVAHVVGDLGSVREHGAAEDAVVEDRSPAQVIAKHLLVG
ncbi:MAG: hypothetical protein JST00_00550 [Deltaproteobacteria bacterium]|nr:hypothetical protein [Deltaproteobacteria bacterium]